MRCLELEPGAEANLLRRLIPDLRDRVAHRPEIRVVRTVQLDLVPAIVRQRAGAELAQVPDVALVTEAWHADRRVGWVVGREVEQRADRRIRLAVVVAVEALEVAPQSRPAVGRLER